MQCKGGLSLSLFRNVLIKLGSEDGVSQLPTSFISSFFFSFSNIYLFSRGAVLRAVKKV